MNGKNNIAIGFLAMGLFMSYGFLLIYLRDFSSEKVDWIAGSLDGKHFESKMAHVHGNLLSLLNVVIGFLLLQFQQQLKHVKLISNLALAGILMPLGILLEIYLSFPPVFVLLGAISMVASVLVLAFDFFKLNTVK